MVFEKVNKCNLKEVEDIVKRVLVIVGFIWVFYFLNVLLKFF